MRLTEDKTKSDGGVVADTPSNETAKDVMAHPSPMGSRSCDVKITACGVPGVAPGPSDHAFTDAEPKYWHGTSWGCDRSPSGACNLVKCNWYRTCVLRDAGRAALAQSVEES